MDYEVDKLFEGLNTLTENAVVESAESEAASKAFWTAAKNNIIDIENFHKAFDEFFDDEVKNLFDYEGLLKHKGTYATIKNLDPSQWATKALKKLWALQFVDDGKTQKQLDDEKRWAEEAEKRRLEREEQARIAKEKEEQRIKDINQELLSHLDTKTISKVIELAGADSEFAMPEYKNHRYYLTKNRYYDDGLTSNYRHNQAQFLQPAKVAEWINKFYQEWLAELTVELAYKNCKWYKAIKDWSEQYNKADYCEFIFQDKAGKVYSPGQYRLGNYYSDFDKFASELEKAGVPVDADFVGLVVHDSYDTGYTMRDSKFYTYVSLSAKANQEAIKKTGVDLTPRNRSLNTANDYLEWGHSDDWEEVSKEAAEKAPNYYIVDGMDKWYSHRYVSYATD